MAIPVKEFKSVVKSLNGILKADGSPVIKIGKSKADLTKAKDAFSEVILDFMEKDRVDELTDDVIDFYNDHIANTDSEEDTGKKDAKGKGKGKGKKGAKGKKSDNKDEKKEKKTRGPSNEQIALEMVEAGKTDKQIAHRFSQIYAKRGVTDEAFIAKRAKIYTSIAKRKAGKE